MKRIAVHFSILLLACVCAAAAQDRDLSYRVGPRDLITIRVDEAQTLNGERRISENGTVNLPLIGDVYVEGKTPGEIAQAVKRLLEEPLRLLA